MKKKPNGYRYFYHLTGCLFGIFILAVLIINFLVPDRGFSQKENRVLASRPAISVSQLTSGKFADGYETYVNDQFFLRDWWITLRATAQRILGNNESSAIRRCFSSSLEVNASSARFAVTRARYSAW